LVLLVVGNMPLLNKTLDSGFWVPTMMLNKSVGCIRKTGLFKI
jgi:hypothetical protein